ncbi:MAG: hypothetical protein HY704_15195 [Gemmatimonadetes bacterium]|nr:hypothetical protein [Gemmatimonadota bacterium]
MSGLTRAVGHRCQDSVHTRAAVLVGRCALALLAVVAAGFPVFPVVAQQTPDLSREAALVRRHMQTPELRQALQFVESQIADPSASPTGTRRTTRRPASWRPPRTPSTGSSR